MVISVETFLVMESNGPQLRDLRYKNVWRYAVAGTKLFPVGSILPIIRKGTGCIGLAQIVGCNMMQDKTEVTFITTNCSEDMADSCYSLYRNEITNNPDTGDLYDDAEDTLIPGIIGSGNRNSGYYPSSSGSSKPRPKSSKW